MIGEDKSIFIDTNILIYANYEDATLNRIAQRKIINYVDSFYQCFINRQVIREFLVYTTRHNFENDKMNIEFLLQRIRNNFMQYQILEDNKEITNNLFSLVQKYNLSGKKIHDANIVATMQTYNITKLLTNNVKDFERFTDVIEIVSLIE
jgi:predicted nucleic acid-binding protein